MSNSKSNPANELSQAGTPQPNSKYRIDNFCEYEKKEVVAAANYDAWSDTGICLHMLYNLPIPQAEIYALAYRQAFESRIYIEQHGPVAKFNPHLIFANQKGRYSKSYEIYWYARKLAEKLYNARIWRSDCPIVIESPDYIYEGLKSETLNLNNLRYAWVRGKLKVFVD